MRAVWISGVATLALCALLAWYVAPLDPGALALQFAFTPRAFGQIIHFWSPADLERYRSVLKWLLPLAACLDTLENALHWWLTAEPRFGVAPVYALSAGVSSLKWLLVLGFGLMCAYALFRAEDCSPGND